MPSEQELIRRLENLKEFFIDTEQYQAIEDIDLFIRYCICYKISKKSIIKQINKLEKEYKEMLEENSTKAFILKCQIEGFKDFLKNK